MTPPTYVDGIAPSGTPGVSAPPGQTVAQTLATSRAAIRNGALGRPWRLGYWGDSVGLGYLSSAGLTTIGCMPGRFGNGKAGTLSRLLQQAFSDGGSGAFYMGMTAAAAIANGAINAALYTGQPGWCTSAPAATVLFTPNIDVPGCSRISPPATTAMTSTCPFGRGSRLTIIYGGLGAFGEIGTLKVNGTTVGTFDCSQATGVYSTTFPGQPASGGSPYTVTWTNPGAAGKTVAVFVIIEENTSGVVVHNWCIQGLASSWLGGIGQPATSFNGGKPTQWMGGASDPVAPYDALVVDVGRNDSVNGGGPPPYTAPDTFLDNMRRALDPVLNNTTNPPPDLVIVAPNYGNYEPSGNNAAALTGFAAWVGAAGATIGNENPALSQRNAEKLFDRTEALARWAGAILVNENIDTKGNYQTGINLGLWGNPGPGGVAGAAGNDIIHPGDAWAASMAQRLANLWIAATP